MKTSATINVMIISSSPRTTSAIEIFFKKVDNKNIRLVKQKKGVDILIADLDQHKQRELIFEIKQTNPQLSAIFFSIKANHDKELQDKLELQNSEIIVKPLNHQSLSTALLKAIDKIPNSVINAEEPDQQLPETGNSSIYVGSSSNLSHTQNIKTLNSVSISKDTQKIPTITNTNTTSTTTKNNNKTQRSSITREVQSPPKSTPTPTPTKNTQNIPTTKSPYFNQRRNTTIGTEQTQQIPTSANIDIAQNIPTAKSPDQTQNIPTVKNSGHTQNIPTVKHTNTTKSTSTVKSSTHNIPESKKHTTTQNIPTVKNSDVTQNIPTVKSSGHTQNIPTIKNTNGNQNVSSSPITDNKQEPLPKKSVNRTATQRAVDKKNLAKKKLLSSAENSDIDESSTENNHPQAGALLNRYSSRAFVGSLQNIDFTDETQCKTARYQSSLFLQNYLSDAVEKAKIDHSAVQLTCPVCTITVSPVSDVVKIDGNLSGVWSLAKIPIQQNMIVMTTINEQWEKISGNEEPLEHILWQITLLAARGRVPIDTNFFEPVHLISWPNMSRLTLFPHSIQVAAFLCQNHCSLEETCKLLNIEHRFVFSFYSAAKAIGLIEHGHRYNRFHRRKTQAGKIDEHENRSLLNKFLQHIKNH